MVDEWLPRDSNLDRQEHLRPQIDKQRAIDERSDIDGLALCQQKLVREQSLSTVGEIPGLLWTRPTHVLGENHPSQGNRWRKLWKLVWYEEGFAATIDMLLEIQHRNGD
jgi:hypothetical protein